MPVGLRKSGIPDSVETPAPVKTTTGPPAAISSAARSISSVRSLIVGSDPRAYQREPTPRPRIRPTAWPARPAPSAGQGVERGGEGPHRLLQVPLVVGDREVELALAAEDTPLPEQSHEAHELRPIGAEGRAIVADLAVREEDLEQHPLAHYAGGDPGLIAESLERRLQAVADGVHPLVRARTPEDPERGQS